jgi:serine/threonine protein kinase
MIESGKKDISKNPTLVSLEEEEEKKPLLPKHIGGYKIESLLNKGGMSLLYLGIHPQTHQPITIKVLSRHYLSEPEMVERFLHEAQIIEMTSHPNIVKIYGHGRWEGGVYIAMEFIQGLTLRQLILQQTMSMKRALEIVLQISHALAHLHAHGVIHRDLKPENILLTAQGGVKVIDFGIAALYSTDDKNLPVKKRIMGTPAYMSPEQRENPLGVSFNSDIYSLGIITYELVLGRLSHGVIHLALMPRGLQKILSKALQSNPKDRYEDIIDFIHDLSAYLASDEMKKEMRGSDYLGELNESLKEAQQQLIPEKLPVWPRTEMAIASNCSTALSSVYYDFFQKNGVYHIVLGESIATGVEGLLYIAILRGMIRALSQKTDSAVDLISSLNRLILDEGREQSYALSYVTLVPSENRFSYISCGYSPLWYLPSGASVPRRLAADNLGLGISPDMDVLEIESNWSVGDTMILHTFQAGLSKSIKDLETDEKQFLDALLENFYLAPKQQVEAIFRTVSASKTKQLFERPLTIISVGRVD